MHELDKDQTEQVTGARRIGKCPTKPPFTTLAVGEEGGGATTMMVGEEGPIYTTLAIGEEGGGITPVEITSALGSF